ncbi:MAG: IS1595 family transposase [Acidobacteriia bacterium]|nr:IS1595 family transposase [Terriglobia bacterium]
MADLTQPQFLDANVAREHLEQMRWPDGPVCPHCSSTKAYKLQAKEGSKKPVRLGVYKCAECREQFTVTVNSIFEDSHIPLNKWLLAIHLLCASKKGMSAHQLHRMLGVTYKSAWFMAHRIRYAMSQPPYQTKLSGIVEADETYVGGKRKRQGGVGRPDLGSHKQPVFAVVQRNGQVRSFHVHRVTADNLVSTLQENVEQRACVVTDGFSAYDRVTARFKRHEVINHASSEYARTASDGMRVHTNTVEGFFGLLKRGLTGTYHQVGSHHLHRYLSEFDFRYNTRTMKDAQRATLALEGTNGKRLMLKEPSKSTSL